jgi:integrase
LRVKPPKSKRGRRNVSLPSDAVTMLRAHKVAQMELRLQLGQGGQPALVFSTIEGGHISPNWVSATWFRICRSKNLAQVPFHALRHTHVSTLINAGVDILAISRRLGHAKAAMTLDTYGHLIEGADEAAAKAVEGMLK